MDLRDLRCVEAIADTGSFVHAARRLNMSQPSVSARMRSLEATLGLTLFAREPRGVSLTLEGAELLAHARRILRQIRDAEEDLAALQRSPVGLVRLGLPTSLTGSLALPLLERCFAELPHVKVRVVESMSGYLLQWLREERLDLAVTFGHVAPAGVDIEPLAREELLLVAQNAEALARYTDADGTVPLRRLADIPLVLPGPEHGLRSLISEQSRQQAITLNVIVEIDALGEIRRLVSRGVGCTVMSSAAFADSGGTDLAAAIIRRPSISRVVNIAAGSGRVPSRATKEIAQRLRQCVFDLARENAYFSQIRP